MTKQEQDFIENETVELSTEPDGAVDISEQIEPIVVPEGRSIGIALGSGSARGWAHIGVLKALAQLGVRPTVVAGCSVGALVGAAYACGYLDEFEAWSRELKWRDVVSFMDVSFSGGFIKGERLLNFLRQHNGDALIEELPVAYAAVATGLDNGKEIWLQSGGVLDAVRASSAFPGLFAAVCRDGQWLIDGGLVNPVPVSLCQAMGADLVIAVDLNAQLLGRHAQRRQVSAARQAEEEQEKEKGGGFWQKISGYFSAGQPGIQAPGMMNVMASSVNIMQDRITRGRMAGNPPDLLLTPQLGDFGMLDFHRADEAIREGESVVYHGVRRLRHMLE